MPLPLIIGGIAAIAGAAGVGTGIRGGMKMKDANDTLKLAKSKQENAVKLLNERNQRTTHLMDSLGRQELQILNSFEDFSNLFEKIKNKPDFKEYERDGVKLPEFKAEELKKVSVEAGILLGSAGGAAAGTLGGIAAAGATTCAVMALGTASTGTAISALSGAAATNATLAALGGGSLAAGGGGMALGSVVLGGATLGVGLLVGGIIFNVTGSKLSSQADEAYKQAKDTEEKVARIVRYLDELYIEAGYFKDTLDMVEKQYRKRLEALDSIVNIEERYDYKEDFSVREQKMTENLVLLVGLLYNMCKVNLVLKDQNGDGLNSVNRKEIAKMVSKADEICEEMKNAA